MYYIFKAAIAWDTVLFNLIKINRCFTGSYHPHFELWNVNQQETIMKQVSCQFLVWLVWMYVKYGPGFIQLFALWPLRSVILSCLTYSSDDFHWTTQHYTPTDTNVHPYSPPREPQIQYLKLFILSFYLYPGIFLLLQL